MAETNMLEIAKNLRLYNRWRRGEDETLEQPAPADIGTWLDAAADALEVGVDAAEARESASAYAHLLAIACSDLEQKNGQLWHATLEANYIEEAIREFEAVKCELLRQVDRLRKERDEAVAEIERWRTATAKLRDGADEAARVATEQLARAEQRVAELEAALRDAQEVLNEYAEDGTHRAARLASERIGTVLARAKPADLVQEACGGRCGDPLCNLSTEGELMREPAAHSSAT